MFTAKINNEDTDWAVAGILMTYAQAFNNDTSSISSSDLSDEALNFCKNYLIDRRADAAIGFDSKRKKDAKYIATQALQDFNLEVEVQERMDTKDYSYSRQILAKATRRILINTFDAGSSAIYEDTLENFMKSETLREPLLDKTHKDHNSSVLIFNGCVLEMKKRLKSKGVFKGHILTGA